MTTALLSNLPPEPAVQFAEFVEDLLLEARNYLDGEPIANEEQANAVSSLLNRARRVSKDADEARKVEAKPFDDGKKAVQARWTPLIAKADLAANTCKQALAPWLAAIEQKQREEAEAARKEAERIAAIAAEAHQKAHGNLEAAEDAERLLKVAEAANRDAVKAGKAKAHATGGERAVGLVDKFTPVLTNPVMAARHYYQHQRTAFEEWLQEQAEKDVRSGLRTIPGFDVQHTRIAR